MDHIHQFPWLVDSNVCDCCTQDSAIQLIQADLAQGAEAIRQAVAKAGHIDGLVNNAACADILPFVDVTEESYDK